MFDFIDKMTAYDVGVIIGLLIVFFIVRFIWFVSVMILAAIEKIVTKVLGWLCIEDTAFGRFVGALFRRLGNLLTRFKFTDPKRDHNSCFDRTVEAMNNGTWTPAVQKEIDRADDRRVAWDNIRSVFVWTLVFIAITLYADPWEWNLF